MQATTEPETYNGWANYPTWCVNLWLSNDEGLYSFALDLTRAVIAANEGTPMAGQTLRGQVAGMFNDWVRDELAPDLGASFAADLLGYALDQVDWYELAGAWIEQAFEDA